MLIGVDGNEANIKNRVGVNQYGFDLLCSIYKLQDMWKDRVKFVIYLKNPPLGDMPPATDCWKYKVLPGRGLWIVIRLMPSLFLERERPDVFFTPSHYIPPFAPMPRVAAIMDLGYLKFKGQFKAYDYWQLKLWSAWSITRSKYIIAISESSRADIVRHFPQVSEKVEVTPLSSERDAPSGFRKNEIGAVMEKYGIKKNYILFLGTLKPSKNVDGLVEAWSKIVNDFPDFVLVIGGKKGWLYESIFEKVKKLGLAENVVFTDFVEKKDKMPLIAGAKVFALPSFWEGFGIDALNAMVLGVPVVVSNVGSLPEVVGDAGILVDPYNTDSIAGGIKKVLSMTEKEYNKLAAQGIKRAKGFSWEATARKTLEVLENATKQRR